MIKKLFFHLIIIFVIYILIIFNAPILSWFIWKTIWIQKFNEYILQFKSDYDSFIKNIPTWEEAKNKIIEYKNNSIEYKDTIKNNIDNIRQFMSWTEDKINKVQNSYKEVKNLIDSSSWKIKKIKDLINESSKTIKGFTNTWIIKK